LAFHFKRREFFAEMFVHLEVVKKRIIALCLEFAYIGLVFHLNRLAR